ncbi:anion permease [Candidatus Bathyarchaeota archaeon]|nr:anion permease [Candidatus Bathyarchaeota archaeon]
MGSGFVKFSFAAGIVFLGIFLGVMLEGGKLGKTVFGGIFLEADLEATLVITVTAIIVLAVATFFRLPVPLSNSLIGATIGIGLTNKLNINWGFITIILVLWIVTPFFAAFLSAIISAIVNRVMHSIKNLLTLSFLYSRISLVLTFYLAYSLGANTLGLISGIYSPFIPDAWLNLTMLGLSSFIGVYFLSRGMVKSVGKGIIRLSPLNVFVAQFSGAFTVHLFTQFRLPVSLVQALTGGIIGIGFAKKVALMNKRTAFHILAGAILAPLLGIMISSLVIFILHIFCF